MRRITVQMPKTKATGNHEDASGLWRLVLHTSTKRTTDTTVKTIEVIRTTR